jgi:hypothetical protein
MKIQSWMRIYFEGEGQGGGDTGKPNGGGAGGGAGGENGGQSLSLRAQLAGQFEDANEKQGFESWANKYTTDKEWLKGLNNMRTTFDQKVTLPSGDSKPEDWDKFYQRIGKPATPKDYKYEWGESKPDDATLARFEGFKEFAHKHHLTQPQVEALVKWNQETEGQMEGVLAEQVDAYQNKTIEFLRKEWGPDFEQNLEYASAAGQHLASDHKAFKAFSDMTILGKEGGMRVGDHPAFLDVMAKVGRMFAEDTRALNMHNSGEAESIQQQIRTIEEEARKANKSTADREYHERLEPLYKKLYPAKHKANGVR